MVFLRSIFVIALGLATVAGSAPPQEPPLEFHVDPYALVDLAPAALPFVTGEGATLEPTPPIDDDGVEQFRSGDGALHYHPVHIAQRALRLLGAYPEPTPEHLALARAHVDRLLAEAVEARGALYYPYTFDFALHGDPQDMMEAPWYSAMAQGLVLSALVRLHEITGEAVYREAADGTFASFLRPRLDGSPWTVFVDESGFLWLEEYAKDPPGRVLNGHIFAIYGLYDYHRLTEDPAALEVYRGALTTVAQYADDFRDPGRPSLYCLGHEVPSPVYHAIHIEQLRQTAAMSGSAEFSELAALFESDHMPDPEAIHPRRHL